MAVPILTKAGRRVINAEVPAAKRPGRLQGEHDKHTENTESQQRSPVSSPSLWRVWILTRQRSTAGTEGLQRIAVLEHRQVR